jgi:two-component system, NtrC family, response regulator AtoC
VPSALILVAEDDDLTRELLVNVLHREGHRVTQATSGAEALQALSKTKFELVLSDIQMTGATGMDVLAQVSRSSPETPVILITAFAQPDAAMDAIAQGAADYLAKPVDVFAVRASVARALERHKLKRENLELRSQTLGEKHLIGTSAPMLELYKQLAQVAPTEATVLLTGESGSGKELVARTVHARSRRASGPYLAVNCASLAEGILESELFGHEKGAFTGAHASRRGVFEEASGGTLFLDEVGDVPTKMQAQLLRVLQEGEVRRVGGEVSIDVDVRLVAATNRDLVADVTQGRMRADLYYRLKVVAVAVPSLRDRGDDVIELARHFIARHAASFGRAIPELAPETLRRLQAYGWPGNVRELENALARAVAVSQSNVLMPDDLPPEVARGVSFPGGTGIHSDWPPLQTLEKRYIDLVMERTRGNKTLAASILGLDRRTIQRLFARAERKKTDT